MKLIEALNIAKACGLNTVGEAVMNIRLHAVSLFPFEDLPSRISIGDYNTMDDIDYMLQEIPKAVEKLRQASPFYNKKP